MASFTKKTTLMRPSDQKTFFPSLQQTREDATGSITPSSTGRQSPSIVATMLQQTLPQTPVHSAIRPVPLKLSPTAAMKNTLSVSNTGFASGLLQNIALPKRRLEFVDIVDGPTQTLSLPVRLLPPSLAPSPSSAFARPLAGSPVNIAIRTPSAFPPVSQKRPNALGVGVAFSSAATVSTLSPLASATSSAVAYNTAKYKLLSPQNRSSISSYSSGNSTSNIGNGTGSVSSSLGGISLSPLTLSGGSVAARASVQTAKGVASIMPESLGTQFRPVPGTPSVPIVAIGKYATPPRQSSPALGLPTVIIRTPAPYVSKSPAHLPAMYGAGRNEISGIISAPPRLSPSSSPRRISPTNFNTLVASNQHSRPSGYAHVNHMDITSRSAPPFPRAVSMSALGPSFPEYSSHFYSRDFHCKVVLSLLPMPSK